MSTREEDVAIREWLYENLPTEETTPEVARHWMQVQRDQIDALFERQGGLCGLCEQVVEDRAYAIVHDGPTRLGEISEASQWDGARVIDVDQPTAYAMCADCSEALNSDEYQVEEIEYRLRLRGHRTILTGRKLEES